MNQSVKKINQAYIGILMICLFSCKNEQQASVEQLKRISYVSTIDNLSRNFFLYLPKGYDSADADKKWPVLMFLHGDGERGNGQDELDFVLAHGPLYEAWILKRHLPFVIIAPQLHMFGRDSLMTYIKNRKPEDIPKRLENGAPERADEFPPDGLMTGALADTVFTEIGPPNGWEKAEQDLVNILQAVLKNYNADENKIYLSGLSYGGFGTWYMASKHPELFAAINPIAGWGHPDLMESIAKAKLPVWVFCGGRDRVVPSKFFYAGLNKLEALGHDEVLFTIHEDMNHDVWKRVYGGEDIYQWLLTYSR